VYWFVYLAAFSRKRESGTTTFPPVSILVCAHDEEQNLRALLPLLLAQEYPEFEVIVVEDRCNDGTYDFLLRATREHPRLKMVRVQHLPSHVNGKKFAITLGIKAATHEWVLLTDADCRPTSNRWIQAMSGGCREDKQIVLAYSPYQQAPGYLNSFIRFESLVTGIQYMGLALIGKPYMGTGRNLAYRKSLFLSNKGFNNYLGLTGGDDDLFVNQHSTPKNTSVILSPDAITKSIAKRTWSEFYFQKLRHLSVGKHYRLSDRFIVGLFAITWLATWFFVFPFLFTSAGFAGFVWVGFLLRSLIMAVTMHQASRTLGDRLETWKTPLLDFNYAIYYLGTGLVALLSKRVRWKK